MGEGRGMENWNPVGWTFLIGGFLIGVVFGWLEVGNKLWLVSYATILSGLAILVSNLIRTLWRAIRSRND